GDETQQPDSANRCPAGQPGVGVGVALIQPGKAGEEPAAKKLLADPESGEAETCQPGTDCGRSQRAHSQAVSAGISASPATRPPVSRAARAGAAEPGTWMLI